MEPILVTGSLGIIGGEIVRQMREQRLPVRAADVDVPALQARFGPGLEAIWFDFTY